MLDETEVPPGIRAEIFERYTFCLPEGELFLAYPVPGRNNETQPGRRAYNIVWYRPTDPDKALVDLCTDATGRCHGMSIPPPLIRPEVTAAIKATARALLAPQVAEIFARTAQPFFQPIFDLTSPRTVFGRVALFGRCRLRRAAPCRRRRDQGRARCREPRRRRQGRRPCRRPLALPARAAAVRQRAGDARPREGAYLSAQLKPREQRSEAELHRNLEDVLLAHNSRSENLRNVLVDRATRCEGDRLARPSTRLLSPQTGCVPLPLVGRG